MVNKSLQILNIFIRFYTFLGIESINTSINCLIAKKKRNYFAYLPGAHGLGSFCVPPVPASHA